MHDVVNASTGEDELALLGGAAVLPYGARARFRFDAGLVQRIVDLLESRPLSSLFGEHDVARFERGFCEFTGAKHAVAVSSGTSALHAALVALGIGPGDEVCVPCLSFVASASVILQVGASPVFVDIERDTLGIDLQDLRRKLTTRTRAVIVVHLFGIPARIEELKELCELHDVRLLEDACQAHGARIGGRHVGTFGDLGCFSFNVNKIIQTGEGGMVITADDDLAQRVRELRVNGLSPFGVERLGFNYTMTNLQALIGMYQLERADEILAIRNAYGTRCGSAIGCYMATFPERRSDVSRTVYGVPFLLPRELTHARQEIIVALGAEGVPVAGSYEILYRHCIFGGEPRGSPCEVSEDIVPRLVSVNPHHGFSESDMELVCRAIHKVLGQAERVVGVASHLTRAPSEPVASNLEG